MKPLHGLTAVVFSFTPPKRRGFIVCSQIHTRPHGRGFLWTNNKKAPSWGQIFLIVFQALSAFKPEFFLTEVINAEFCNRRGVNVDGLSRNFLGSVSHHVDYIRSFPNDFSDLINRPEKKLLVFLPVNSLENRTSNNQYGTIGSGVVVGRTFRSGRPAHFQYFKNVFFPADALPLILDFQSRAYFQFHTF